MSKLPKRPRQHTLEKLSRQHVESILPPEWIVEGFENDYGLDLQVEIVKNEQVTGAHFYIQLKSTDHLVVRKDGYIAHPCKTSTLRYFLERPELVIYVVYDAQQQEAYWIWIQDYLRQTVEAGWQNKEEITIRIPKKDTFDQKAVQEIEKRVREAHSLEQLVSAIRTAEDSNFRYSLATGYRLADLQHQGAVIGVSLDVHGHVVTIGVHPKHPEALAIAPVKLQGRFLFDESVDGQVARTTFERVFKAGAPAQFNSRFFEGFGLPNVLTRVLTHIREVQMQTLEILPITSNDRFPLRLTVFDASGKEIGEVPYVECRLTRQGSEESTFENDSQDAPLRFRFVVNHIESTATFHLQLHFLGESVVQVRDFLHLQEALAHAGSIKLTNIRTGISTSHPTQTQLLPDVDENFVRVISELAFVQEKLNQLIVWSGEVGTADIQVLHEVSAILRTGNLRMNSSQFTVLLPTAIIRKLVSDLPSGEAFALAMTADGTIRELLGTRIELGGCIVSIPDASLSEDIQALLSKASELPEDQVMKVTFNVGAEGMQLIFPQWQPTILSDDAHEN
jgi:hypothetical protein